MHSLIGRSEDGIIGKDTFRFCTALVLTGCGPFDGAVRSQSVLAAAEAVRTRAKLAGCDTAGSLPGRRHCFSRWLDK